MALTDTQIRKAKQSDKPYRMSDGGGLYLQIVPSGGKLWRWKYRFDGKEKLMALGKYPDVSLAQARERHAVSAAYIHARCLQPRTKMMQGWADYLEHTQQRGVVVTISGRIA
ncbi:integrase arm-type DNA-binding domain-containing protein [Telmatobacter bradus]|uniref:Arm DNA-binding domain-containing protein n=1 Tax=Telmatobacter bradus TaxID=474953 RepID=UPI003B42B28A